MGRPGKAQGRPVKVGCCGFAVSQKEYFERFRLIEIQNTFYKLPRLETAEKWRTAAPPGFEFTLKAWQLITHPPTSPTYRRLGRTIARERYERYGFFRPTAEVLDAWQQTAAFARALGANWVVFQCPASFRPIEENIANLQAFFSQIDRTGFRFAWEPRGDWPPEVIRPLCKRLTLIHCVDPFQNPPVSGSFQYFRLHGITGYRYRFTDPDLEKLVPWARQKPSYVLFNNISMGEDARRFLRMLECAEPRSPGS